MKLLSGLLIGLALGIFLGFLSGIYVEKEKNTKYVNSEGRWVK